MARLRPALCRAHVRYRVFSMSCPCFRLLWLSIPSGFLVVFEKPNRSSFTLLHVCMGYVCMNTCVAFACAQAGKVPKQPGSTMLQTFEGIVNTILGGAREDVRAVVCPHAVPSPVPPLPSPPLGLVYPSFSTSSTPLPLCTPLLLSLPRCALLVAHAYSSA